MFKTIGNISKRFNDINKRIDKERTFTNKRKEKLSLEK
jgi:hypothetical protein